LRIVDFEKGGVAGIEADDGSGWHGLNERESGRDLADPSLTGN
jgi:acylpyruvate hydrolase